jgi:hypothetical protein
MVTNPSFSNKRANLGEMHYSALIGGVNGARGTQFVTEFLEAGSQVTQIQVGTGPAPGNVIKALRFDVLTATRTTAVTIGASDNASWQPPYSVSAGRTWSGISGASGWYLDNIRFHFDDGTTTPCAI